MGHFLLPLYQSCLLDTKYGHLPKLNLINLAVQFNHMKKILATTELGNDEHDKLILPQGTYKVRLISMSEESARSGEHGGAVGALGRLLLAPVDERSMKFDCLQVWKVSVALRAAVPVIKKLLSEIETHIDKSSNSIQIIYVMVKL